MMQFYNDVKFVAEDLNRDYNVVMASIVNNIMQGVFVLDKNIDIVYTNKFILSRIKKELNQIVGLNFFHLAKEMNVKEIKIMFETVEQQKKMISLNNFQHFHPHGEHGFIDLYLYPILNYKDVLIGYVLIADSSDVGKKYFRDNYKINVFLRYVVNAMTEGATVIDGLGNLEYANDRFYKMLGYEPKEVVGKHWSNWCYEGDLKKKDDHILIKDRKKKGNVFIYKLRLKKKNGDLLPVLMSVSKNVDQDFNVKSVGVIVDVTENVKLKLENKQISDSNRKILETISTGIITFDNDLRIKYINNQVELLFGKRIDEVQGFRIAKVLPTLSILEEWSSWVMRSLKPYQIDRYKLENTYDDRILFLNVRIHPILNKNNHLNGVVCAFDDVSTSARLEEQIEQSFRKLELAHSKLSNLLKRQKDFLADISHELRTPLTVMSGNIEIVLQDENSSKEELIEVLMIVESELKKMTSMVRDITSLTKMEDGKMELKIDDLYFSEILKAMFLRLENFDKGFKNVYFEMDKDLKVAIDKEKIESMIWNLIENGLKYTNDNGMVIVKIFCEKGNNKNLIIEVEDNGVGIPEAEIEYIFDRFYRVDKARSREKGGSGLGLAIVKTIVNAHRGTIEVSSKVDKGTIFKVTLPVIIANND